MADPARETLVPPFTAFHFRVELSVPDLSDSICSAAFSECDGLEMTMEPKTIREGGNNNQPIHLIGPVSYGQLSLKRGMTDTLDLWDWFERVLQRGQGGLRASGEVVMLASDGVTEQVRFTLSGCLPIKIKAPALNAKDGLLAIEEMQIAYEMLRIQRP
jgi:phage tail-like protein